jgi:hypothetical protein
LTGLRSSERLLLDFERDVSIDIWRGWVWRDSRVCIEGI